MAWIIIAERRPVSDSEISKFDWVPAEVDRVTLKASSKICVSARHV